MAIPLKVSKYQIKQKIGQGSMGAVYEAFDPFVQREVAIKVSHEFDQNNPQLAQKLREGFFAEIYAAGRMHHPAVISIYDAGQQDNLNYIVMEFVDGETLQHFINGPRVLTTNQIIDVIYQCAKGLDYVHRQGIIHRDLKPGNIMLSHEGEVKIMDFSIAHFDQGQSSDQTLKGSPMYLPPEQLHEETCLVEQSDIYSLGAVMYALLARRPLFKAATLESLTQQILELEPDSLSIIRPDLPQQVIDIVEKCLSKNIEDRYQNAEQLADILSRTYGRLRGVGERIDQKEKYATLRQLAFFKSFSDAQVNEVVSASDWMDFKKGQTIISEGEIESSFYIMTRGSASVRRNDKNIGLMYQGDCFGETAFIRQETHHATITARTDVTIMLVSKSLLDNTSLETQLQYYRVFLETLVGRLSKATPALIERDRTGLLP
ncbi:MAG: protein kinase [Gammaproteobacteria bacterium]|nr:protein kinase [Gammaproteobacteria bacterium]MBL6999024.1 protein kinase [Gammaproteobacteria bacterium]